MNRAADSEKRQQKPRFFNFNTDLSPKSADTQVESVEIDSRIPMEKITIVPDKDSYLDKLSKKLHLSDNKIKDRRVIKRDRKDAFKAQKSYAQTYSSED